MGGFLSLPLEGIRIVAISQYGAGPYATMHLADLGAEVIKIEDPSTRGDSAREVRPYTQHSDSLFYQSFNRNKKSVTLNLRNPSARDVFHRLVKVSDVVFNNLRGDQPARWWFGVRDHTPRDYVLARWVYSELPSGRYSGPQKLTEKARKGAPFDELGQAERDLLVRKWRRCEVVHLSFDVRPRFGSPATCSMIWSASHSVHHL